jgi:hypothetical protein
MRRKGSVSAANTRERQADPLGAGSEPSRIAPESLDSSGWSRGRKRLKPSVVVDRSGDGSCRGRVKQTLEIDARERVRRGPELIE